MESIRGDHQDIENIRAIIQTKNEDSR